MRISKVVDKKQTYLIKSDKHYFFVSPSIQNRKEIVEVIASKCQDNKDIVIELEKKIKFYNIILYF